MERTVDGQTEVAGRESVSVRSCPLGSTAPYSLFEVFDQPRFVWADESAVTVAGGMAATITADGPDRFGSVREQVRLLFDRLETPPETPHAARPRLFGGFAFTETHRDPGEGAPWNGYPGAWFTLPATQVTVTPSGTWLTTAAVGPGSGETAARQLDQWRDRAESASASGSRGTPGVRSRSYAPPLPEWQREIGEATTAIREGKLRKVVLAQALTAELERSIDPGRILSRLGESYPDCFRFLFEPEAAGAFFGATPERLVTVHGETVET
jgi:menaquinone-specific isochorismate synthase